MKKYHIGRNHLSEHSVQRGSPVLDLLDALAGAWQLVLSADPSFRGNASLRGAAACKNPQGCPFQVLSASSWFGLPSQARARAGPRSVRCGGVTALFVVSGDVSRFGRDENGD